MAIGEIVTDTEREFFTVTWEMVVGEKPEWDKEEFREEFRKAIYRKAEERNFFLALRLRLMIRSAFLLMELEFGSIKLEDFPFIVRAVVEKSARGLRYGH